MALSRGGVASSGLRVERNCADEPGTRARTLISRATASATFQSRRCARGSDRRPAPCGPTGRPAGRGKWEKEPRTPSSADRRAGRHLSPRPPFRVSSVLSFRACRIATVRTLLGLVRDHDQPSTAAARAALRLLHQRRAVAVALRAPLGAGREAASRPATRDRFVAEGVCAQSWRWLIEVT
jgi:hypothetical protein